MRLVMTVLVSIGVWLDGWPVLASAPSIESVAPGVGQRGTEFQLRLKGAGLADAAEVMLYSSRVACIGLEVASDNEVTARMRADEDCPLGSHPFRLRTKQGLSELRIFRVTPFPIIAEVEPNNAVTEPQTVPRVRVWA